MGDEAAFLQAIVENPGDESLRLIYADWLDDRSDSRGELFRIRTEIGRLVENRPAAARSKKVRLLQARLRELWATIPNIREWLCLMERGWQIQPPLIDLVLAAETGCVLDCCGIDALEITEANAARWLAVAGTAQGQQALQQVNTLLDRIAESNVPLAGERLNHSFTVEQSVSWLCEWRDVLSGAMAETGLEPE